MSSDRQRGFATRCQALTAVVRGIIRVALRLESVEGVAIIRSEWKFFPDAPWKIRIRNEVTTKRYCVGISLVDGCCCALRFKATVGDDFPSKDLSRPLGGHRRLVLLNHERAAHARLDDMQIRKAKSIQTFSDMGMQCFWVGVGHRVERAIWSDAHAHAVMGPRGNHCFDDPKEETGSVFDRTTVFIRSFIAAVLKKLVNEIAVPRMNLDPIEAGRFRTLDCVAIVFHHAGNLRFLKSAMGGGLYPTTRRRN